MLYCIRLDRKNKWWVCCADTGDRVRRTGYHDKGPFYPYCLRNEAPSNRTHNGTWRLIKRDEEVRRMWSKEHIIYLPIRGPRLYNAMADALSRSENRSLTDPCPTAIGALAQKPATSRHLGFWKLPRDIYIHRKRNAIRAPVVGANAHPRFRPMVMRLPIWRIWGLKTSFKKGQANKGWSDAHPSSSIHFR